MPLITVIKLCHEPMSLDLSMGTITPNITLAPKIPLINREGVASEILNLMAVMQSPQELLVKKQLCTGTFDNIGLTLDDRLDIHIIRLYCDIYSRPYLNVGKSNGISRLIHGIQHVTRAAINIPIFANLYRCFGNVEALALTDKDIKLLQIAALFHDSAREDEGVDHWDQESGLFFYEYVTKTLGVTHLKAKLFAEAIANKDADETNYFELKDMAWVKREGKSDKNIYQKLIHDADCLEIIRARDHFDANYLDFYKDIAKSNNEAFEIMAKLITEARSLIASQGDSRLRLDIKIKAQYENRDAYRKIMTFITENKERYPLILSLSNNNRLISGKINTPLVVSLSKESSSSISEESLTKAMYAGKLFARSVGSPAAYYKARKKEDEYTAKLEIRKMTRRKGVPTRTKKSNNLEKMGNPHRSVTMLYGVGVYAGQGFLILNPNIDQISTAYPIDFDTGRGKKSTIKISELSQAEKEEQLKVVHRKLKMGGTSRLFWHRYPTTHNEIIYRITEADAIYFTQDSTPYNEIMYGSDLPCNYYTHYLQALFLQIEYEKVTGKKLPIFEYSGVHNFIKAAPIYTEEEIVAIWVTIVSKLIIKDIDSIKSKGYFSESLETLKIKAIDGYIGENILIKKQTALDLNYSHQLREKINLALEEEKLKLFKLHIQSFTKGIKDGYEFFYLLELPLDKLNALQREQIFIAIGSNLGTLIKDSFMLRSILGLSLDKLNALQREQIFTAIGSKLGILIKDDFILVSLFELPLEKLNAKLREKILNAIEGNLGTIIKKLRQVNYLLNLPLDKLSDRQRCQIFTSVEGNLGDLITDADELLDLFNLTAEQLNYECREKIWMAVKGKLYLLITSYKKMEQFLSLSDSKLNAMQRAEIRKGFEMYSDFLIDTIHYNPSCEMTRGLFPYDGLHGQIDYKQTLRFLISQPSGTYLLVPAIWGNGAVILVYVDRYNEIHQDVISRYHRNNDKFMFLGNIYPSIQAIILHYSIYPISSSGDVLKTALFPFTVKEDNSVKYCGVETVVSKGMFKQPQPIVEQVASKPGGRCCSVM